jgi:hypothetical protein
MLEPKKLCKRNVLQWVVHTALMVGGLGEGGGFQVDFSVSEQTLWRYCLLIYICIYMYLGVDCLPELYVTGRHFVIQESFVKA